MTEAIAPNMGHMHTADILARANATVNEDRMTLGDMEAMGLSGQRLYQQPEERNEWTGRCEVCIGALTLVMIVGIAESIKNGKKRRQKKMEKYRK